MVAMYVAEPSQVTLTVQDHVRVDRVTVAGVHRYGELLRPGTTTVDLAEGSYLFRTTRDAQVALADATAVRVVALATTNNKDTFPESKETVVAAKGDTLPDHVPALTVL
jgi:hypothetical protein